MTTRLWLPRRSRFPLAAPGEALGAPISAPDRGTAERIAVARHGRGVVVELIVRQKPTREVSR